MSGLTLYFSVQPVGVKGLRCRHYGAADCSSGYCKGSSPAATEIFSPELTIKAVLHGSGTERDGCKTYCCFSSAPVGQLWMLIQTSVLPDLRLPRILHIPLLPLFFSYIFFRVILEVFNQISFEFNVTLWFCCFLWPSFTFLAWSGTFSSCKWEYLNKAMHKKHYQTPLHYTVCVLKDLGKKYGCRQMLEHWSCPGNPDKDWLLPLRSRTFSRLFAHWD